MTNFTALLTDLGNGLGAFMNAIGDPLVTFVIYIGIGGAIVAIIYGIARLISKKIK